MKLITHLFWLCTYTALLVRMSECVPCIASLPANTMGTCEIDNHHCFIHCDLQTINYQAYTVTCVQDCFRVSGTIPCTNISTSDQYQLCCSTPYCNNITSIPLQHLSSTAIAPSPSSNGTNKDTSDDVRYHIVIAVCVVVVVLVIAIATGCVVVMWMKLRGKQDNKSFLDKFRWRKLDN